MQAAITPFSKLFNFMSDLFPLQVYTGVKFSCKFTLAEIQERWYALLYDPVISQLAVNAMKQLHPDTVAQLHANALYRFGVFVSYSFFLIFSFLFFFLLF